MNIKELLPLLVNVPEVQLFYRARAAVGVSLNNQGQEYVMQNWPKIPDFLETPEGKAAIVAFVNAWVQSSIPKSVMAEPVEPPASIPALDQLSS